MQPVEIIKQLEGAGIHLSVDGVNILATPKAAITDEARYLIRQHKAEILQELRAANSPQLPDDLQRMVQRMAAYWNYSETEVQLATELASKDPDSWRRMYQAERKEYGWTAP